MFAISNINIRRPGLRIWSMLFCPDKSVMCSRRVYWFRLEKMVRAQYLFSMSACTLWEPRDLWVGAYWDTSEYKSLILFICLIPCLPLRLHFKKSYGTGGVS